MLVNEQSHHPLLSTWKTQIKKAELIEVPKECLEIVQLLLRIDHVPWYPTLVIAFMDQKTFYKDLRLWCWYQIHCVTCN